MRKILNISLLIVTIVLAVISYFILPDNVIIQLGFNGLNTTTKLKAILLPLAISVFGFVVGIIKKDNENNKGFILSIVGILVLVLEIIFNLK